MNEYDGILMGFLDEDLYKFTMQQVVLHHFPQVEVEYEFRCRNKNIEMGAKLGQLISVIEEEIHKMKYLTLQSNEKEYLKTIKFLKPDYIEFLENFRYNPEKHVRVYMEHGELAITIKGNWVQTILYEVPILAIVSELATKYNFKFENSDWKKLTIEKLDKKIKQIKEHKLGSIFKFACFGTRRRASAEIQDIETRYLNEQLNFLGDGQFIGTSNVHLAMKYSIKCIGTIAHEYLQAFQVLSPLYNHLESALNCWIDEYRGNLGIILTDSITTDVFLKTFDSKFAKIFDGVRQDSGCPFEFGEKIIKHYNSLGINSETKQIVFSDGLDIETALQILEHFYGKINVSFGIGTHLTNDIGIEPANIVIKMVKCNNFPVAKISDNPIKSISSSQKYIDYIKELYNIT